MSTHHVCDIATKASASCRHRRVFGDLVPIEQYSNGSDGRHHRTEHSLPPEQSCTHGPGCNCIETSRMVRRHFGLTTTTEESD